MPTLPTVTTDFLSALKASLNTGDSLGQNLYAAPKNYLLAQDFATALELLQDALDSSSALTAISGTGIRTVFDGTRATVTLTLTDIDDLDTETVTLGSKTYTFQDTLTDVDGNVFVGVSTTTAAANLAAAINLGAGSGTAYAASTTAHPTVSAVASTNTVVVSALLPGIAGNSIASTETLTDGSFGSATLLGGLDAFPGAGGLEGMKVVFTGNTTPSLAGVEATVASNTVYSVTFTEDLPVAAAAGDTYTFKGAIFDSAIDALRQGTSFGGVPAGNAFGEARVAKDALAKCITKFGTRASRALTLSANLSDGDTVTIGAKVYTFQATLTNVDGNVQIGASAAATISNFAAAVNLGSGSGTAYAAATTLHPSVTGTATSATVFTAQARNAGTSGNSIPCTETSGTASWAGATLTGGTNSSSLPERTLSWAGMKCGTGSTESNIVTNITMAIDQFRGKKCTISGESRKIVQNTETDLVLEVDLTSAPAADVAISITEPDFDPNSEASILGVHPGMRSGENYMLAYMLDLAQSAVEGAANPI